MNTNPGIPSISTSPAVLSSNNTQTTAGSRESSEFEFVGNNGSGQNTSSGPPATLQTDQRHGTEQIQSKATPSILPTSSGDVLDKPDIQNTEDEGIALPGLFGWVKGTGGGILSKVAEKTKSSMETVITTLDPQVNIT